MFSKINTLLKKKTTKRLSLSEFQDLALPEIVLDVFLRESKMDKNEITIRYTNDVWLELKRYLWLVKLYPKAGFGMASDAIDGLWHAYILCTRDYQKLGWHLGRFIHHQPESPFREKKPASITGMIDPYLKMVIFYHHHFGEYPNEEFWKDIPTIKQVISEFVKSKGLVITVQIYGDIKIVERLEIQMVMDILKRDGFM